MNHSIIEFTEINGSNKSTVASVKKNTFPIVLSRLFATFNVTWIWKR
jgi:hypothetical protein